jgi:hypothetical protein
VDPRIAAAGGWVAADGLQQKDPAVFETAVDHPHERTVVFPPDMLEDADGNDFIESALEVLIALLIVGVEKRNLF